MTGDTFDEQGWREPPTERVRIVGASRAGDLVEGDTGTDGGAEPRHAAADDADDNVEVPDEAPEATLPHWTEAPTGEVPAVLDRRGPDDDPWASVAEPTWREASADWDQDDPLATSLLAGGHDDDLPPLPSADPLDRQPWSFELGEQGEGPGDLFAAWTRAARDAAQAASDEPLPPATISGRALEDDETATWDPDLVAGERTTQLHLPAPGAPIAEEPRVPGDELAGLAALDDLAAGGRRGRRSRRPAGGGPRIDVGGVAAAGQGAGEPDARHHRPPAGRMGRHASNEGVSGRTGRNIPVATATGVAVGAVALAAFSVGTVASMVVVTAVLTLAAMEAFAAYRRAGHHPATLLGLVAVVSLMVGTYTRGQRAVPIVLVLLVAFTVLWHLAGVDRRADPVKSISATLFVVIWVGVFGSYAALLLAPADFPDRHGIAYLLGALIAGVAYDVGALAVGAWIGRHPLSAVSPGKTWEGLVGGTVATIVVSVAVVHLIHPWTLAHAAALGLVVAVVSPVGDLGESLVKRSLGLKDMGRILPGHGGLLDRIDGLLFVLPAAYYLLRVFHAG